MRRPLAVVCVLAVVVFAGCTVQSPAGTQSEASDGIVSIDGPAGSISDPTTVTVTEIIDGDTVEIRFENGSTDRLRLLGVDTPEVHVENDPDEFEGVPSTTAGTECLREAGHAASAYMEQYEGMQVQIAFDSQSDTRGSYGRLLVYLFADDQNVNFQLVERGHARVYDTRFTLRDRFDTAEMSAQDELRNVWQCRSPTKATSTPTQGSGGPLAIVDVHADAAGNDHENLNDEYVVFENTGNQTLDMSRWTVSDEATHRYVVPDGTTLEPGARLTLYSGAGTDTEDSLYWDANSAVWNNGGDTVTVERSDGSVVVEASY